MAILFQFIYLNMITKNNLIKQTVLDGADKTLISTTKYNPTNRRINKFTCYYPNGKIEFIREYDKENGDLIKTTYYQSNGQTIDYIEEYNQDNYYVKTIHYTADGKDIDYIEFPNDDE